MILNIVRDDKVCRQFMTVPGVGALVCRVGHFCRGFLRLQLGIVCVLPRLLRLSGRHPLVIFTRYESVDIQQHVNIAPRRASGTDCRDIAASYPKRVHVLGSGAEHDLCLSPRRTGPKQLRANPSHVVERQAHIAL
jgi:hypothetical protein